LAVKINDRLVPEAHEVNDRIKYLIKNSGGIFVFESRDKFPITGLSNALYRAEDTNNIYSWDAKLKEYKQIGGSSEFPQIQVIFGGTSENKEDSSN
jgi:hypothetical protein